jgi:glutathione S-transferase
MPFEHRAWSTFADVEQIRPYNPLTRVPTLVLDDGEVLIESHSILDYLDGLVPAADRLFPAAEPARHQALKVAALATGVSEKAVSLFYEKRLHKEVSDVWAERCRVQVNGALAELEANRKKRTGDTWFGNRIGHADIAIACALRFIPEAHPGLIAMTDFPALAADAARLEALPAFQTIAQKFIPPA